MIVPTGRRWDSSDPAIRSEVLRRAGEGENFASIGLDFYGTDCQPVPKDTVRSVVRRARRRGDLDGAQAPRVAPTRQAASPAASWASTADGGMTVESPKSAYVQTLDDLVRVCAVDLTRWRVARYVVNKWDNVMRGPDDNPLTSQLFQVKAWLEPLPGVDLAREVIAGLLADLASAPPLPDIPRFEPMTDHLHMLELDPFDLHVGMLSWAAETGADYDSDIATDLAIRATQRLIKMASGFDFERVLIPLGNDWLHTDKVVDGKGGVTARGTAQDVDTRRGKMVRAGITLAMRIIEAARHVAPVEVVIVPGNHDTESMFMLGEVLAARYHDTSDVTVRNDPDPRHYVRYGASLIGLTHGHEGKPADLPLIMATERPMDFANSTFRLWRIGHLHRKGEWVSEHSGVRVCVAPSLAARDHWHAAQGYGHLRAMEGHIWHREYGPVASLTASVPALERKVA